MKMCLFSNASDSHTHQLVNFFARNSYEILLFCHTGEYQEIGGVRVETLEDIGKLPGLIHFRRLLKMRKLIRQFHPDFLYIDTIWPRGIYGALLGFHPMVLSAWGSDISVTPERSLFRKFLVKWALNAADVVRVHDEAAKKRAIELGCNEKKIIVHVLGTDIKKFTPNARSEEVRKRLGIDDFETIISVRKLKKEMDVQTFIMAIPHVIKEEPKVRFLLCGDGPEKRELMKLTDSLGIRDHVIFSGKIPHEELPIYIASADIFVDTYHTSKAGGGIGVGLMEAMSCGLAPVVARRPGIDFAVNNNFHGLHFQGGNPTDLAEKIIELITNKDKVKLFGDRSREYMVHVGDYNRNITKFEKELRERLFDIGSNS